MDSAYIKQFQKDGGYAIYQMTFITRPEIEKKLEWQGRRKRPARNWPNLHSIHRNACNSCADLQRGASVCAGDCTSVCIGDGSLDSSLRTKATEFVLFVVLWVSARQSFRGIRMQPRDTGTRGH
jgi:hypothetical protein